MNRRRESLRSQSFHRNGLSRLDVLVLMLLSLMMLASCIPGLGPAREAARKSTCKDNLHQMGIALHNYHEYHNHFPPGAALPWDFERAQPLPTNDPKQKYRQDGASWMAYLLPFMDLPSLAEDLDPWMRTGQRKTIRKDNNREDAQVCQPLGDGNGNNAKPDASLVSRVSRLSKVIPAYECPSAGATKTTAWGFGTATYAGNFGPDRKSRIGFFAMDGHCTRMNGVTDGLTYTIAVSEAGGRVYPFQPFEPADTFQPQWVGSPHGDWRAVLRLVRHDRLPNTNDESFNSGHPGGVHVLAADGAVHWIGNRVHPAVWVSHGTIRRLESTDKVLMKLAADKWKPGKDKQGNAAIVERQSRWPDIEAGERPEQIEARRGNPSMWLWAGAGAAVLLLVLIVVGIVVLAKGKKKVPPADA